MSTSIHPPSKIHVTGVTRVTVFANRQDSLALASVTRLHDFPYTRRNAALRCNAGTSPSLAAGHCSAFWLECKSRWLRLQDAGRGIVRYTLRASGND
jgi:hypothetical protein